MVFVYKWLLRCFHLFDMINWSSAMGIILYMTLLVAKYDVNADNSMYSLIVALLWCYRCIFIVRWIYSSMFSICFRSFFLFFPDDKVSFVVLWCSYFLYCSRGLEYWWSWEFPGELGEAVPKFNCSITVPCLYIFANFCRSSWSEAGHSFSVLFQQSVYWFLIDM